MARYTGFHRPNRPLALYAGAFALFLYLPILFIPLFSFNAGVYVKFPLEGFTLAWYADLLQREPLQRAFWNSVQVAA
ncbi:MAG: ABC transporter permease, partial [Rhodobacterales bacterium]